MPRHDGEEVRPGTGHDVHQGVAAAAGDHPATATHLVGEVVQSEVRRPLPVDAEQHPLGPPRQLEISQETPFSFIETYGPRNHSDPVYHEHFAIGDVPPGEYTLGVEIEGQKVYRRIRVEAGKLTWVVFRPGT